MALNSNATVRTNTTALENLINPQVLADMIEKNWWMQSNLLPWQILILLWLADPVL